MSNFAYGIKHTQKNISWLENTMEKKLLKNLKVYLDI